MNLLALDTSGPHCAVGLATSPDITITRFEPMKRGQAERLMILVQEVMAQGAMIPGNLDAIVVGVGPGNFTGIRIAVSAARGLALGCGIPMVSVTNFELMRGAGSLTDLAPQLVSLAGPRDAVYLQPFDQGRAQAAPSQVQVADHTATPGLQILGARATQLAGTDALDQEIAHIPETLLALGMAKFRARIDLGRPAPLYAKAPDAAPSKDAAPVILP